MKTNLVIVLLFICLTSCVTKNTKEPVKEVIKEEKSELFEFPNFNSKFTNKTVLNVIDKVGGDYRLDSIQYLNWTDKFVPNKTDLGRLYSCEIYSAQPQLENIAVLALKINADGWYKLHLATIDQNLELVDQIPISDSWSDLIEAAGDTEIIGKQRMYSKMISERKYHRFDIRTTEIINYYSDSTTYEIDSVITLIEILNDGTLKLTEIDSVRTLKYGGIE